MRIRRGVYAVVCSAFLLTTVAITASVLSAAPAGASRKTSSWNCNQNSDYGSVCQKVFGSGLNVTDIGVIYTESHSLLSGKTWRFETTFYSCNPNGVAKSKCPSVQTKYGPNRSGSPAANGSVCASAGISGLFTIVLQQCQDYGEASGYASQGDLGWVPHTLAQSYWSCDEIQIWNATSQKWVDNGAGTGVGVRACNDVFK